MTCCYIRNIIHDSAVYRCTKGNEVAARVDRRTDKQTAEYTASAEDPPQTFGARINLKTF